MPSFPGNLYELLHVPTDASYLDIRRAYRRRALACHPDKQVSAGSSSASGSHTQPPTPPPFVIIAAAATLLLDPLRRKQYDQLLFLDKLSSAGRISNADEVIFGLEAQRAGEFSVLTEEEDANGNLAAPFDFRWCGLECRCGGWYRVSIPCQFFSRREDGSLKEELADFSFLSPPPTLRTVHVECESCSLTIAVEQVPTLEGVSASPIASDGAFKKYVDLFLGLDH